VKETLPRLLYIGDVPVSNSFAGATLLYRLLTNYPPDRLTVCAPIIDMAAPLKGVRYVGIDARWPRLFRTRLSALYCAWISWRLNAVPRWSLDLVREFRPHAVLTISQTSGWILAWRIAQRANLPLFMLAHDDHVYFRHLPRSMWPWAQRRFADAYRHSARRFCISEFMAKEYQQRFGVPAETLLPSRDPMNPVFKDPAPQTYSAKTALTFAFAGSIHGNSGLRQLLDFGRVAAANGHTLIVYSPQHEQLSRFAAGAAGLDIRPPISSAKLAENLREEADCLLVTGSFDSDLCDEVSALFPSKVADYSAIGLPLIAWAPKYASIARFIRGHGHVAELVTDADPQTLAPALLRLAASPQLRQSLARSIIDVGLREFSPESAWDKFSGHLRIVTLGKQAAPSASKEILQS
jgi:glycosyltransferase involved in cell wall biosynthesis